MGGSQGPDQLVPYLTGTSGFFTVSWRMKYNGYLAPVGFFAEFASSARPAAGGGGAPPSTPAPAADASVGTRAVSAGTLSALQAALADPSVGSVAITAQRLELAGAELPLPAFSAGRRSLTLRGACAEPPCTLDARSLSRHFTVPAGTTLVLDRVRLSRGAGRLGGAALVLPGGTLRAVNAEISDSASVGTGGCVCAVGPGATVEGFSSAWAPPKKHLFSRLEPAVTCCI